MSKPEIVVRIVAPVGTGKTHVAETIRKALEIEYGGRVNISLTDIVNDMNTMDSLVRPQSETTFKIVESHKG